MKLTFKMTGEEYYLAWKYRKKKLNNFLGIAFYIILAITFIALFIVLKIDTNIIFLSAMIFIAAFIPKFAEKKAIIRGYELSVTQNTEHTIRIYDEGIELFNSYKKVFAPWKSIYAVEETDDYLKIFLNFGSGWAVINKKRYAGRELDDITEAIKKHVKTEGGRQQW